jgi:hypothetical protein
MEPSWPVIPVNARLAAIATMVACRDLLVPQGFGGSRRGGADGGEEAAEDAGEDQDAGGDQQRQRRDDQPDVSRPVVSS